MHFHWQNLNERPHRKNGFFLKHFRCWLGKWRLEWHMSLSESFAIGFSKSNEEWRVRLSLLVFSVYFGREGCFKKERCSEVYWYENTLWIKPWCDLMEWNSKDPWWRQGVSVNFADLLLGKAKYFSRDLLSEKVLIPMPEGSYKATVRLHADSWSRPRWFTRTIIRATVDVPAGLPYMGKGENSWDCGEDATYQMTTPAKSVAEAISKIIASVLDRRKKYGTPDRIKPVMAA